MIRGRRQGNHRKFIPTRLLFGLVFALILAWQPGAASQAQSPAGPPDSPADSILLRPAQPEPGAFAPGRVIVRWRKDVDLTDLAPALQKSGWPVLQTVAPLHTTILETGAGQELAAIQELSRNPLVLSAEPDYLAYALGIAGQKALLPGWTNTSTSGYQPNDPQWVHQWSARRVKAPTAWELSTGAANVIIAIVDSGIDMGHPEFAGRLMAGYDYVNQDTWPQDDYGHGTHIAGIAAAAGDNRLGIAGLAWGARILPLKVLDNTGAGTASNVALGVFNAASQNATIINLSLALTGPSTFLHDAIQVAYGNGALIVASSGNEGGTVAYPAAYPEVLAVAATTHWEDWAPYSNYGPQIDLAAPGGQQGDEVLSTSLGGGYAYLYGTSIAAPHVAGVAALMQAISPSSSNITIAGILRNTAEKVGSYPYSGGRNDRLGYGRINAALALRQMLSPNLLISPASLNLLAQIGGLLPAAEVVLSNPSSQPVSWQLMEITEDWLDVEAPWNGSLAYPGEGPLRVRVISQLPAGSYDAFVRLRATTLSGQQRDHLLPVHLRMAPQLHNHFLPQVENDYLVSSWVDAAAGGIALKLASDGAEVIGLPFAFPFYGINYNQVWIHANGFLSFGQHYAGSHYAVNGCLPSLAAPNGAIYVLWDDLDPGQGGQIYFRNLNNDYIVVEWRDVPSRGGGAPNTFQVVLWPDGRALLQYRQIAYPGGVTVGAENWDASMGWQIACNGSGAPPAPGQAFRLHTALAR